MKKYSGLILVIALQSLQAQSQTSTSYIGSTFSEAQKVIYSQMAAPQTKRQAEEFNSYGNGKVPTYTVNLSTVFSSETGLEKDARRTLTDKADFYNYIPKRIHANGVCLMGEWTISRDNPYTGLFKKGTQALFVGRASVTLGQVTNDGKRGFGFAGKIFPTMNLNERVQTLNFFTADVLMGTNAEHFLDVAYTNEPDSGFNLPALILGLKILNTFKLVDENPMYRPVNHIAQYGNETQWRAPRGIRISPDSRLRKNNQADFRHEILQALQDNHGLAFNIDVSDATTHRNENGWTRIGQIKIYNAITSYGCDRQLHFAHPKLR